MRKAVAIILLLSAYSCNQSPGPKTFIHSPMVFEAKGYVVPNDSILPPKIIPAGKPRIIPAGRPEIIPVNSNVHIAGTPEIVISKKPLVCTPGKDGFALPEILPAVFKTITAGIPETTIAKEPSVKENNPYNFSSYGQLQGLKSSDIFDVVEDKAGNLWIGNGTGLSRYDGKTFIHYTRKQGPSPYFVRKILEDSHGNIWLGGSHALSKYDGKTFTNFKLNPSPNVIWINDIIEDKTGNLWIGTTEGLYKFNGEKFTYYGTRQGLSSKNISSLLEDKNGNVWIGTLGGGINIFNGTSFTHFIGKEGSVNAISDILEDRNGNLWFATSNGIVRFDGIAFTRITKKQGLVNNNISSLLKDRKGDIWIGDYNGVLTRYDGKYLTHFAEIAGTNEASIWNIKEDRRGNIWLATGGNGIIKYNGGVVTHFKKNEGIVLDAVQSCTEDSNGNLWFGTLGGVSRYDGKSFSNFTSRNGLMNDVVWNITCDRKGNLWFGTYKGVSKYDGKTFTNYTEKEGLLNNDVKCMLEDKKGNIWFGSSNGVTKFDGVNFIQFAEKQGLNKDLNVCTSIMEDANGYLWFGSCNGVTRYDGTHFTHFTEKNGLPDDLVLSIMQDNDGFIWFATPNGLGKYDGKTITRFTEYEGLSNNDVISSLQDRDGNLWFGTSYGLSRWNKSKSAYSSYFNTYTYEDGFSGVGVRIGKTLFQSRDGTIWIGASDRLTAFHPEAILPDTIPVNMQLSGVQLYNETIGWQNLISNKDTNFNLSNGVNIHDVHFSDVSRWYGLPENLSLPYNNNYVSFQFVGINTNIPKKIMYQYKLEGLDKDWSPLTQRSEATFGNLPHGNYTFKVKAVNDYGIWSNEYNYGFEIRPPWWQTWWAYALFAFIFIGLIYALFRYRLNKLRMKHEIVVQQHKVRELEMQALRSQMNPHFIFNSLNSINLFILENNKLQASEYLTKFSRLMGLILHNSQESFVPLEKELEAIELYLELESLRFENKFSYNITVDPIIDTSTCKVPPLIIQPYVENAIWHGLMHKKEHGNISMDILMEENMLFCRIIDDGIGRKKAAELKSRFASKRKSVGMTITADRIAILQEKNKEVTHIVVRDLIMDDGSPGGTEVTLKIPLMQ